jgi:hypothetical protein
MLISAQAGSTTDIGSLRVIDLDTGVVVYTNGFGAASDATNELNLFYYVDGTPTNFFTNNFTMTRVVNGKLRLETTGFGANGNGGYNSHSEAEYAASLPRNFLVDFNAIRLQWAGAFAFNVFYRQPSDALSSYNPNGGAFSTNRIPPLRLDVLQLSGSGNWFNNYGLFTNYVINPGLAIPFSAPSGDPTQTHRYGISLSNSVASFYLDGVLLNSTNISSWISTMQIGLIKAVKPSFSGLSVGTNYQLQVSSNLNTWTNQGTAFTATNANMIYPQYWDVENWNQLFFRFEQQ